MNGMKLAEPSMKYDAQIQAYRKEFLEYGGSMDGTNSLRQYEKTQDWLDHLEIRRTPELLPPGRTLSRQYLYIREADEKIVGMISLRPQFNEYLEKYGGNIGYSVVPGERRKGYATGMLKASLPLCRELGLKRVLITCIKGNEGSKRTILKNGGVYESAVWEPDEQIWLERYWISLEE